MRRGKITRWGHDVLILALSLAAFSLALLAARDARTEPPSDRPRGPTAANESWDGYSELLKLARAELGASHVEPRATLHFDALEPEDALWITHPEVSLDEESIMRFLAGGGRVLILDDFGKSAPLLERFQIRREPLRIENPRRYLAHNPAFAVARPVVRQTEDGSWSRHPTTEGVREIVTNHATALVHPELTTLLEVETTDGAKTLAATGVIEGKGRLVVVGDSSLFINLMLRYPGNRVFLSQLARYSLEREGETKRGKLYVVGGSFQQKGSFGQLSPREELAQRLRSLRAELERLRKEGLGGPASRFFAVFFALLVVAFELRQGRPNARVRVPAFAADGHAEPPVAREMAARLSAGPEQDGAWILAELREALELTLMDRLGQTRPLVDAELERALENLPQDRRRPSQELVLTVRAWTDPTTKLRARRPSEAEVARVSSAVITLLEELRPRRAELTSDDPPPNLGNSDDPLRPFGSRAPDAMRSS